MDPARSLSAFILHGFFIRRQVQLPRASQRRRKADKRTAFAAARRKGGKAAGPEAGATATAVADEPVEPAVAEADAPESGDGGSEKSES